MSIRRRLHFVTADVAYYGGLISLWRWFRRVVLRKREVLVLGLHRVLDPAERAQTGSQDAIVLSRDVFAGLLEYARRKFRLIPASAIQESVKSASDLPTCAITFDDGWIDNYACAFSLLRDAEVPATIFVVTGFMDTPNCWVEQLRLASRRDGRGLEITQELGKLMGEPAPSLDQQVEFLKHMPSERREAVLSRLLTPGERRGELIDHMFNWDQAREMVAAGIEIGSHTHSHPLLTFEKDADVARELRDSRQRVERELGLPAETFAYPNGDWDPRVRGFVEQAGYKAAFTTRSGWYAASDDNLGIPRVLLHDGNVTGADGRFSPAMFNFTLTGWRS